MPRIATLLDVARTFCQRAQCWEFNSSFMPLNVASRAAAVSEYAIDVLAATCHPAEVAALPGAVHLAIHLRLELARLLLHRGFRLGDMTSAALTIDVPRDGDGSLFGLHVALACNGRTIVRALDAEGRAVSNERHRRA